MYNRRRLVVTELDRDRYARFARVELAGKTITTPHFCTLVKAKNPDEFDIFLKMMVLNQSGHIGSCLVRLFDAPTFIAPKLENMTQTQMDDQTKYVEENFIRFFNEKPLIIDPATEYLFYEHYLPRWLNLSKTALKPILEYVEDCVRKKERIDSSEYSAWKEAYHTLFWNKLSEDAVKRNKLIGDVFDLELKYGSSILLPPVPVIRSEKLLEISVHINYVARGIATSRDAEYANYFILSRAVLSDDELISRFMGYVTKDPSRIKVFKFKYLDLTGSGRISEFKAYGNLMQELSLLKEKDKNKVFMILDNWHQVFPSAVVAFDAVSSSMTGYDYDSNYGQGEYGSWYDPELMNYVPWADVRKHFQNGLPCSHEVCRGIEIRTISADEWNVKRRIHYVQTMGDFMVMIKNAIGERKIELAIDKLINSDISRLKKLIPRI